MPAAFRAPHGAKAPHRVLDRCGHLRPGLRPLQGDTTAMNERTQSARASAEVVAIGGGANKVLIEGVDRTREASVKGICSAISFSSLLRSPCRVSTPRAEPRTCIEYSITPHDVLRPPCGYCGQARTATRHIAPRRDESCNWCDELPVNCRLLRGFRRVLREVRSVVALRPV